MASNFGELIQAVGAAWMMTMISQSQDMIALVQTSTALPIMLFSIVAGALADSFDRRRVMLTAQFLMLIMSAILTVFSVFDLLTPWLLLAFTFVIGCGIALNSPSWQASVGDIVPRPDLPSAVTLNSMGFNLTRSVGPAIGGAIVAIAGAAAAFAVNTLSYIAIIYALWRWKPIVVPAGLPREKLASAIFAGLRYVSMSPNLKKILIRGFVFGVTASSLLALLPAVAITLVGGGPLTYGFMLGSFGIGAICGAMLNARVRAKFSSEIIVRCSFAAFAVATATTAVSSIAPLTCAALFIAGAAWVSALSLFNTLVQLSTPRWVVGRALSLYQTVTFGGIALGSWVWGAVADRYDVSHALVISAVAMQVGIIVGYRLSMPEFSSLNLDPLNRFVEPSLALNIKPRSGPIVIQVDYRIAEADLPEFMLLMGERRRIRIRDGARQWALMRDLAEPLLWTESYHTPTWIDYLRHNQRRTQSDADNYDRLQALHQGDDSNRVRRMIERQTVPVNHVSHRNPIDRHY